MQSTLFSLSISYLLVCKGDFKNHLLILNYIFLQDIVSQNKLYLDCHQLLQVQHLTEGRDVFRKRVNSLFTDEGIIMDISEIYMEVL